MCPVTEFSSFSFRESESEPQLLSPDTETKPLKWSEARRLAIRRDKICRICNAESPLTVHHLWPRGLGGGNGIENLLTLCEPCHQHLCSCCSRNESARVPGWVKPNLARDQSGSQDITSDVVEAGEVQGSLAGLFSDAAMTLAITAPRKLLFFWELAEAESGISEERN